MRQDNGTIYRREFLAGSTIKFNKAPAARYNIERSGLLGSHVGEMISLIHNIRPLTLVFFADDANASSGAGE